MSVLWLVALTIIFAVLQAAVFSHFNFKKLTYTRAFDKAIAFEGDKAELLESIENKKMLPVPWLRAESRIPKQLHFEKEQLDAHEVSGGLYHKGIFYLSPMLKITRHHEAWRVQCGQRRSHLRRSVFHGQKGKASGSYLRNHRVSEDFIR